MKKETLTQREVGLLIAVGLLCTVGSIWWLRGFAVAALAFGVICLAAAWCCVDTD